MELPLSSVLIIADQFRRRGRLPRRGVLPQAKPTHKGVRVVAGPRARGKLLQLLDVPSTQHDIVGLESCDQPGYHIRDIAPPLLLSSLLEAALPDVLLVGALLVGQVPELHRLDDAVGDE